MNIDLCNRCALEFHYIDNFGNNELSVHIYYSIFWYVLISVKTELQSGCVSLIRLDDSRNMSTRCPGRSCPSWGKHCKHREFLSGTAQFKTMPLLSTPSASGVKTGFVCALTHWTALLSFYMQIKHRGKKINAQMVQHFKKCILGKFSQSRTRRSISFTSVCLMQSVQVIQFA